MKMNSITKWSFSLIVAAALVGCATEQRAKTAQVATDGAAAMSEATGPTEAEALHVITTVNNAEIEAAQLAKARSKDKRVLSLANHIIKDHGAMNQQVTDLAQRLNLEPDNNEISRSIQMGSSATMSSLKNTKGQEFNRAFIAQQVRMHQTALEAINDNLIPNAKNEEVRSFLEKTRVAVASHLEHAQQLQSEFGKTQ